MDVTTAVTSVGVNPVCHAFGSPVRSRTYLIVARRSSCVDIAASNATATHCGPCPRRFHAA